MTINAPVFQALGQVEVSKFVGRVSHQSSIAGGLLRLPALCVALLLGGCVSGYEMKVDAISKPDGKNAATKDLVSYRIKNRNPSIDEESLRYKEAKEYVKTALSGKGMYEAPSNETADLIVNLDYGLEQPRVKMEQSSVPIYAQVGGGVRYDQVPVTNARGTTSYRTVAVYEPPRSELIGYQDVLTPVTVYEKYLRMSAHENREMSEGKAPAEVWSVNVSTEDESKDIRKYLPILAASSADYIGKDSGVQKTIKIRDKDEVVGFIKKGM